MKEQPFNLLRSRKRFIVEELILQRLLRSDPFRRIHEEKFLQEDECSTVILYLVLLHVLHEGTS